MIFKQNTTKIFIKKAVTKAVMALFLLSGTVYAQAGSSDATALSKKKHNFYSADTQEAKGRMADFTEAELEQILNEYKNGKTIMEQRTLWLIGELEARKADRVAADRLFYLFLAVVLTVTLILGFVWRIHSMQSLQNRLDQHNR